MGRGRCSALEDSTATLPTRTLTLLQQNLTATNCARRSRTKSAKLCPSSAQYSASPEDLSSVEVTVSDPLNKFRISSAANTSPTVLLQRLSFATAAVSYPASRN